MRLFRRKTTAPEARKSTAYFWSAIGGGKGGLSGAEYDRIAAEGYQCIVAFACINMIATAAASVEWQLYLRTRGKLAKVESHPLLDLIESPNPAQSGTEFRQWLISYHRLAGNAYVLRDGLGGAVRYQEPRELTLLNPGKVKIEPGPAHFPLRYEYKPDPNRTLAYPVDQVTGKSAVLHLKTFNPLNSWYGLPPLSAAALPVDIHTGGQQWNNKLIENGARPSGALVVQGTDGKPGTLNEEQRASLEIMLERRFSGSYNAGRPIVLEGGLDWKEMGINPKDMEFLEGKHSAARDIALAFGVPPMLLGIPGDNTYSNMQEAKVALWTDTLIPLICGVLESFNRWLTPAFGKDLYLWYDPETIDALEPVRKAKADRINTMDYLTPNEKRRAMGYDDFAEGKTPADDILVDSGKIPLSLAGDMGLAEPDAEEDDEDEGQDA